MTNPIQLDNASEPLAAELHQILAYAVEQNEFEKLSKSLGIQAEEKVRAPARQPSEEQNVRETKVWLRTLESGERAGRLHEPDLFMLRVAAVERAYENRHSNGTYLEALRETDSAIEMVHRKYGLKADEYWPLGEGPEEYLSLVREYDGICNELFLAALREFCLDEAADLFERDRDAYNTRRELGRKSLVEGLTDVERLDLLLLRYEREAKLCSIVGAFGAAATMLGAALEGALLKQCLLHPAEAQAARSRLPSDKRPKKPDPKKWSLLNLLDVSREAGWLPDFTAYGALVPGYDLANLTRDLRNLVHPAIHLSASRPKGVARATFAAIHSTYQLLKAHWQTQDSEGPT